MTDKARIICHNPQQAHKALTDIIWPFVKNHTFAGVKIVVEAKRETRSLEQNARLWALLADVSKQVDWYGNNLTPDEWKDVFTAALKKEKVVPGINGGFVVLGQSTSKMSIAEMVELQTLIEAFGADKDVKWSAYE
jgi:hypothetical protein